MISKSRPRSTSRSHSATGASGAARLDPNSYWARSMRPLQVLAFLLPLLIAYEIGSILYLSNAAAERELNVAANKLLFDFFNLFGLVGAYFPGIALVIILLVWHVLAKDPWRVQPKTLAGMLLESVLWTMPLLVMAATINHARTALGQPLAAMGPTLAQTGLFDLSLGARLTIAVGAGLYEEMLFRMVGLALLHFILADLIGLTHRWAAAAAIVISSLAFAVYHQPQLPQQWPAFVFMVLAGIYFGTVYVMRGFGIVVACHALYDVLVLAVFTRN